LPWGSARESERKTFLALWAKTAETVETHLPENLLVAGFNNLSNIGQCGSSQKPHAKSSEDLKPPSRQTA